MAKSMPEHLNVRGAIYKFCVFRISSRDEQGRPEECVFIPEDRVVELDDGDQFMTAYLPKEMTEGDSRFAESSGE